jgi:hypothetical protein
METNVRRYRAPAHRAAFLIESIGGRFVGALPVPVVPVAIVFSPLGKTRESTSC